MKTKYITIQEYKTEQRLANSFKTCDIPYKKSVLLLTAIIMTFAVVTPFTNLFLFPLAYKVWGKA